MALDLNLLEKGKPEYPDCWVFKKCLKDKLSESRLHHPEMHPNLIQYYFFQFLNSDFLHNSLYLTPGKIPDT